MRPRLLHSLILGLMGLSLVAYSSYYTSASLPQKAVQLYEAQTASNVSSPAPSLLYAAPGQVAAGPGPGPPGVGIVNVSSIAEEAGAILVGTAVAAGLPASSLAASAPAAGPVVAPIRQSVTSLQPAATNGTSPAAAAPAGLPAGIAGIIVGVGSAAPSSPVISTSGSGGSNVVQKIPPKPAPPSAVAAGPPPVMTKDVYESGHDYPIDMCPDVGRDMQVLVAVTSAPSHREARMAVRQTWGHYGQRSDVAIVFMLGSTNNAELEKQLAVESDMYRDLIRGRFMDSYNNLTLKTISILEWVDNYCPAARFVLKTDDDMFINVPKLISFLSKHNDAKRTIFGKLAKKWKPVRNKKSKYYVPPSQYKNALFPDFMTGPAYVLTRDVIHDVYNAALKQTYMKLEDVFTTGIVAQSLGLKRVHVNEFTNKRVAFNACNIQKCISIHMVKYHEQFDLWKKLLDGRTKCK